MPDPDGEMVLVEHGADIMRMHAVEVERQDAEPALAAGDQLHAGDARQTVDAIAGQRLLVVADPLASEPLDEIDRPRQPDCAGYIGGAGLEAVRRVLELGPGTFDLREHAAAGL